jgi:hypothetical protein
LIFDRNRLAARLALVAAFVFVLAVVRDGGAVAVVATVRTRTTPPDGSERGPPASPSGSRSDQQRLPGGQVRSGFRSLLGRGALPASLLGRAVLPVVPVEAGVDGAGAAGRVDDVACPGAQLAPTGQVASGF